MGKKKGKGRGRQQQNTRPRPHAGGNDPQFSLLVKTFFGIIQCLHHVFLLESQISNGVQSKAFKNKVRDLNSFVRPACSNEKVKADIERVNSCWARDISKTLWEHYKASIFDLRNTAEHLVSHGVDGLKAKNIAISWAQRNYRKKLNLSVLDRFNLDINDMLKTTHPPPPPSPHRPTHGSPPSPPSPPQHRPQSPSPKRTYSQAAASPVQTNSPFRTPPSCRQQEPSPPRTRSSRAQAPPPPKSCGTAPQTKAPDNTYRAPNTLHKEREWKIPSIPEKVKTLVIGTSNISKITSPVNDSISLMSFPGAKFFHFASLFRNAKASGIYAHVDKVIFACGINDRGNNAAKTTLPSYKRACNAARELFPNAQVFFVLPNWEASLEDRETHNLDQFKKLVQQDKSGSVHLIPSIPPSEFLVSHDKVHWTAATANRLLTHWLGYVNAPPKN